MNVVYLTDERIPFDTAEEHFAEAAAWASRQCLSYVDYNVQDVSDVSYNYDYVARYTFNNPKDAMLFQLKWS